jgi:hypothetical protein
LKGGTRADYGRYWHLYCPFTRNPGKRPHIAGTGVTVQQVVGSYKRCDHLLNPARSLVVHRQRTKRVTSFVHFAAARSTIIQLASASGLQ